MSPKLTPFEDFEEIHQVVIEGTSDNISSLVKSGKYSAIKTADTTTNLYYVIQFISEEYTLQNNTTINIKTISAGKLFVKAQYLCSMQENTNCN